MKPFCFVRMPFGKKTDDSGRPIDFDRVYAEIISPASDDAEFEPIRADQCFGPGPARQSPPSKVSLSVADADPAIVVDLLLS